MLLRSHLRKRVERDRRPLSSNCKDTVVEASKQDEAHRSLIQPKDRKARSPSHEAKRPLHSILKKPRFSFIRVRKTAPMSRKVVYTYKAAEPQKKEAKKKVRFALPDRADAVRPAQSVSTTDRKRSSTMHPRSKEPSTKRAKYPEPILVAAGLSSILHMREAQRPQEMAKAKAQALAGQRRSKGTAVSTPAAKERRSYSSSEPNKKLSVQLKPSELLGGYDWARVRRRTVYGWYR